MPAYVHARTWRSAFAKGFGGTESGQSPTVAIELSEPVDKEKKASPCL
jgi:hypothetical protein